MNATELNEALGAREAGTNMSPALKAPYARGMAGMSPIVPELPIIRTRQLTRRGRLTRIRRLRLQASLR
jgi:hypothetical protein